MKNVSDFLKYLVFVSIIIFEFYGLASGTARMFLGVIVGVLVIYLIKTVEYLDYPIVRELFFLLMLNAVYYFISPKAVQYQFNHPWGTIGFFSNIVLGLSVFFISYSLSLQNKISEKEMKLFFIFTFIALTFRFFETKDQIAIDYDGRMRTMNMAYDFVVIVPFIYLFKRKLLCLLFIFLITYFVAYGGKRGAIFTFLLSAAYMVYLWFLRDTKKNRVLKFAAFFISIGVAYYILADVFQNSSLLQHRLDMTLEGDTNGRSIIAKRIMDSFWDSPSAINFFLGYGFCSSVKFAGNYAHNDWLELLSMSGLLGVTIYAAFFLQFIFLIRRKSLSEKHRTLLIVIFLIWLLRSFFSMSYCDVGNMPLSLLLGYLAGFEIKKKKVSN